MKLLFIRHGETDTNTKGTMHQQNDPVGLNEKGKQQAKKLIIDFRKNHVEAIYTSPENRAEETAKIVANELNIPIIQTAALQERNWGEMSGKTWEEVRKILDPLSIEERYAFKPKSGESWQEMELRLKQFLEEIVNTNYQSVGIVTHEGALRAIITYLKNEPKEKFLQLTLENGSISEFIYQNNTFHEVRINDISHSHE